MIQFQSIYHKAGGRGWGGGLYTFWCKIYKNFMTAKTNGVTDLRMDSHSDI